MATTTTTLEPITTTEEPATTEPPVTTTTTTTEEPTTTTTTTTEEPATTTTTEEPTTTTEEPTTSSTTSSTSSTSTTSTTTSTTTTTTSTTTTTTSTTTTPCDLVCSWTWDADLNEWYVSSDLCDEGCECPPGPTEPGTTNGEIYNANCVPTTTTSTTTTSTTTSTTTTPCETICTWTWNASNEEWVLEFDLCEEGCECPPAPTEPGTTNGDSYADYCVPTTTTTTTTPACECSWAWNSTSETWLVISRGCNPDNPECVGGCSYPPDPGSYDGEEITTECAYLTCADCCGSEDCCTTTPEPMLMISPMFSISTTTTPRPQITPDMGAILQTIKQRIQFRCIHLGMALETRSSCGCGKSSLKHSCAILGECRLYAPRATDSLPQCTNCPHYEAPNG